MNDCKGAKKLCFTHYSCVVIILFNTGLYKSAVSTYFFAKLDTVPLTNSYRQFWFLIG